MRAAPARYVAQRRVPPRRSPVIEGDELQPRSLVLRSFVVADGVDGYQTMPGALSLVGGSANDSDISIARGARSKDTWVISDGAVSEFTLLRPPAQPVELTRGGGDLPSRVADNFFWLGRYAERAEAIARLARVICLRLADRGRRSFATDLVPLVAALEAQAQVASGGPVAPVRRRRRRGAVRLEPLRIVRRALFDAAHRGDAGGDGPGDRSGGALGARSARPMRQLVGGGRARSGAGRRGAQRRSRSRCSCWPPGSTARS